MKLETEQAAGSDNIDISCRSHISTQGRKVQQVRVCRRPLRETDGHAFYTLPGWMPWMDIYLRSLTSRIYTTLWYVYWVGCVFASPPEAMVAQSGGSEECMGGIGARKAGAKLQAVFAKPRIGSSFVLQSARHGAKSTVGGCLRPASRRTVHTTTLTTTPYNLTVLGILTGSHPDRSEKWGSNRHPRVSYPLTLTRQGPLVRI